MKPAFIQKDSKHGRGETDAERDVKNKHKNKKKENTSWHWRSMCRVKARRRDLA